MVALVEFDNGARAIAHKLALHENFAPTFRSSFFEGEFDGQEFLLLAMYWSFIGGEKSVVLRHCVGTDENGDPIERSIVDRNPAFAGQQPVRHPAATCPD